MVLVKVKDNEYFIDEKAAEELTQWLQNNAQITVIEDEANGPEDEFVIDITPTDSAEHLINKKKGQSNGS